MSRKQGGETLVNFATAMTLNATATATAAATQTQTQTCGRPIALSHTYTQQRRRQLRCKNTQKIKLKNMPSEIEQKRTQMLKLYSPIF